MTVGFRWLGVAGLELVVDDAVLLIDPFVSRFPLWRAFSPHVRPEATLIARHLPRADGVLVTHAHWDHLLDVPEIVRQTGAPVYGSANTCRLLTLAGVAPQQCHQIAAGDSFTMGPFRVRVLSAEHWRPLRRPLLQGPVPLSRRRALRPWDYRMDTCFSFLVEAGGVRWLNWVGVGNQGAPLADILFITLLGAPKRYPPLLQAVRPWLVVPVHWDNFFRPVTHPLRPLWLPALQLGGLEHFRRRLEQRVPGIRVFWPALFRFYALEELRSHG